MLFTELPAPRTAILLSRNKLTVRCDLVDNVLLRVVDEDGSSYEVAENFISGG